MSHRFFILERCNLHETKFCTLSRIASLCTQNGVAVRWNIATGQKCARNSAAEMMGIVSNTTKSRRSLSPETMILAFPSTAASRKRLSFGSRQASILRLGETSSPRRRNLRFCSSIYQPYKHNNNPDHSRINKG
jgi:hypothetical protein